MKCPHCGDGFGPSIEIEELGRDIEASFLLEKTECTECRKKILTLIVRRADPNVHHLGLDGGLLPVWNEERHPVWPPARSRKCPRAVPAHIARQYREAGLVIHLSPDGSAALSRRCLQAVLVEEGTVTKARLYDQIEEVLARGDLPSYVTQVLHGLRKFGNLGAHQERLTATGEIVDVESGEADWMLSALDAVFDHYYVKLAATRQVLKGLEAKRSGGEPPTTA